MFCGHWHEINQSPMGGEKGRPLVSTLTVEVRWPRSAEDAAGLEELLGTSTAGASQERQNQDLWVSAAESSWANSYRSLVQKLSCISKQQHFLPKHSLYERLRVHGPHFWEHSPKQAVGEKWVWRRVSFCKPLCVAFMVLQPAVIVGLNPGFLLDFL